MPANKQGMPTSEVPTVEISFEEFKQEVLHDYKMAVKSREASILARKEVLTGKAKFGIVGDGKELPQIAMSKVFRKGDFRSGYYRDQTFAFASGLLSFEQFFAQLYADADIDREPHSCGRQMNAHFSTHSLDEKGNWKNLTSQKNTSADISTTGGQMPRLLGLAQASQLYRAFEGAYDFSKFSQNGDEIAFGSIGDASTAEGMFWETLNAACALQVPMVLSIWDDDYGISVRTDFQRAKVSFEELLSGFQKNNEEDRGCEILSTKAWDYPALIKTYEEAERIARTKHIPVVVHVQECTQQLGHSTSGSHERYKTPERLEWERTYDCNQKFKEWILNFSLEGENGTEFLAQEEELEKIEKEAKKEVLQSKKTEWTAYQNSIKAFYDEAIPLLQTLRKNSKNANFISPLVSDLENAMIYSKKQVFFTVRKVLWMVRSEDLEAKNVLKIWLDKHLKEQQELYSSFLYSQSSVNGLQVEAVAPAYEENAEMVDGRIILRDNFKVLFERHPELITFGEDTGRIGDVNQGMEGMQDQFGALRVSDTGIRECTIAGQGIGLAMRGLRPIAEIQYLDYIYYAIETLSDDLATLHWRSFGKQKAPVIIRTRGHRLEGIWHAGSPMGTLVNMLKGIYILVPRNMTQAAGFYNTMMESDNPCVIIESLNGYRLKEKMPNNLGAFKVPLGKVEITQEGSDITVLTYGSTWRLVMQAATELTSLGINIEVVDIQSLIPFDLKKDILQSLQKTNRLLIVDEDVSGGGAAYILQQVLEEQNAYHYLDSAPKTLIANDHRTAFASDGDYFTKPYVDDIVEACYAIMNEANPSDFPAL